MDVLIIIVGVIAAIASLASSIIAIVDDTSKTLSLFLLAIAVSLIKVGREINRKKPK